MAKTAAQTQFVKNSKKAHALVKGGKAANLKEAWAMIKADQVSEKSEVTKPIFFNGLW